MLFDISICTLIENIEYQYKLKCCLIFQFVQSTHLQLQYEYSRSIMTMSISYQVSIFNTMLLILSVIFNA